jgi:hypothetical protein
LGNVDECRIGFGIGIGAGAELTAGTSVAVISEDCIVGSSSGLTIVSCCPGASVFFTLFFFGFFIASG